MGLPSYVLYGPSTLASSIDASRDAKYIVSKISSRVMREHSLERYAHEGTHVRKICSGEA